MKTQTVKEALFEYVKSPKTWFYWYHNPERIYSINMDEKKMDGQWEDENFHRLRDNNVIDNHQYREKKDIVIQKNLNAFFEATLDEARLKKANAFSKYVLWISGNRPLTYFRKAASKREVTADIDYNMQRDHAVHTLYNYILGWYFFDNYGGLQKAFEEYLRDKLGSNLTKVSHRETKFYQNKGFFCLKDETEFWRSINLANEFGDVWSITSLLHDTGYILEGTISTASTEVENVRVINGSKVIHDYFNHWFWEKFKVDYRAAQNIANHLDVSVPDFKSSQSLSALGDRLCDIGSCENIRKKLMNIDEFRTLKKNNKVKIEQYDLNREAFSIWNMYYEIYACDTMKNILKIVKDEYYDALWSGYNQGYRNLNHGVGSGLIVLQALTFYHEFVWGFKLFGWKKFKDKQDKEKVHINCISKKIYYETRRQIIKKYVPEEMNIRGGLSPYFWFKKVLWATASIAIHDLIQKEYYEKICKKYTKKGCTKIGVNDDPLAFLGVLVDALQEWDRYTISGESAFSEKTEVLQSADVGIYIDIKSNNKINFYFPPAKGNEEKDFAKDIEKALNRCLINWDDLVGIGKNFSCCQCGAHLWIYQSSKTSADDEYEVTYYKCEEKLMSRCPIKNNKIKKYRCKNR